jgi:hypothetical protein
MERQSNGGEIQTGQAYFNDFQVLVGTGGVTIKLSLDNQSVITLRSSNTVAKKLAEELMLERNRPEGYFAEAYQNPDPKRLALEEAMGQIDQSPER